MNRNPFVFPGKHHLGLSNSHRGTAGHQFIILSEGDGKIKLQMNLFKGPSLFETRTRRGHGIVLEAPRSGKSINPKNTKFRVWLTNDPMIPCRAFATF